MRPFQGPRPSSVSRRMQYSKYDASTLSRWLIVRGWRGFCAECARDSTLLRTSRELGDVAADDLTRDVVGIASRGVQPTEEMREAQRVSALRVDRTIAQAQLR